MPPARRATAADKNVRPIIEILPCAFRCRVPRSAIGDQGTKNGKAPPRGVAERLLSDLFAILD
jgi:hypothetical protein